MDKARALPEAERISRRLNQILHDLTLKQYSSSGSGKAGAELRTEEEAGVKAARMALVRSLDVRLCK